VSQRKTRRSGSSKRRKLVLIFGEDHNDTKSLRELFLALCPGFSGTVKPLARPPILLRDARPADLKDRAARVAALIEAEQAVADVMCIFAHEDCDECEPAHNDLTKRIQDAFASVGHHVHAVAPAWELETWWFLWPRAVREYRPSWATLDSYAGMDLGRIRNSKEELRRALRPQGQRRTRDYRESDAPGIAGKVRELGVVDQRQAQSESFRLFREAARACCEGGT
jgi:hypothetical protein